MEKMRKVKYLNRSFKEYDGLTEIKLNTHCPSKYLIVDLETTDIWRMRSNIDRLRRIKKSDLEMLKTCIKTIEDNEWYF